MHSLKGVPPKMGGTERPPPTPPGRGVPPGTKKKPGVLGGGGLVRGVGGSQ